MVFKLESRTDYDHRFDTFFSIRIHERLKSILVYHGEVTDASNLVRGYDLTYEYSDSSSRSILTGITAYGDDVTIDSSGIITGGTSLPEMSMEWPGGDNGFGTAETWLSNSAGPTGRSYNENYQYVADFNGDGKSDYMWYYNGWIVALSNGDGFDTPTMWLASNGGPGGCQAYSSNGYNLLGDFNGDGKTDYMWYIDGWHVALSNGNGFDTPTTWLNNSYTTNSNHQFIGDFDGDGKSDYMWYYNGWRIAFSNGTSFVRSATFLPVDAGSIGQIYNTGYEYVADFNGDGKSDYMWYYNDWYVALSNGDGFDTPTMWLASDGGPYGLPSYNSSPDRFQFIGDFNGDGKSDYMWYYSGWHVALSEGDTFYTTYRWLNTLGGPGGCQTYSNDGYQLLGDFNGDGKSDFMWYYDGWHVALSSGDGFPDTPTTWLGTNDGPGGCVTTNANYQSIGDFNGDGKSDYMWYINGWHVVMNTSPEPDSIIEINTPLGATITIDYYSSSEWVNNYLPFRLQTVQSITTTDNQGHTVTKTFEYEGGKYNPIKRKFYGFEEVVATDHETGFVTTTHYLLDDIYYGLEEWKETVDSNENGVARTDNTWSNVDYGDARYFKYIDTGVVTKYDENGDTLFTITTEYEYDDYGNLLSRYTHTSDGINSFTRTEYNNDTTNWLLGFPNRVRTAESDPDEGGTVLRETEIIYHTSEPWLVYQKKVIHWEDSTEYEYITSYTYDSYGNVLTVTDPRSKTTTMNYDASNGMFPNVTTDALGHSTTGTFDSSFGKVLTVTDPNNQTITYTYDIFGRQETVTYPDGSTKYSIYNVSPDNHYVTIQETDRPDITLKYDNLGRIKEERATDGISTIITNTTYDNEGRITAKSQPYYSGDTVYWTTYQYDTERGYMNRQDNPDSTYITISPSGLTEIFTDENSHSRTITKDSLGRIKEILEPTGGVTKYTYDIFGNITGTEDPEGNKTFISYDDLGRKTSMDDAYMGHWEYDYDENGNLVWQKDSENREIEISYDDINRIYQKNYLADNRIVTHTYDEARSGYYNTGSLTTLSSPEATYEFNYDKAGRQINEMRTIDSSSYEIERGYDAAGRLEYIIYPDNERYNYNYDSMGNLTDVSNNSTGYVYADFSDHNALGQIGYSLYGNGTSTEYYYYTGNNRLMDLITHDSSDNNIQSIHYTFDNIGNISTMQVNTVTDASYTVNHTFTYDEVNRLETATATCTNDPDRTYSQGYTYDLAGNMTEKTGIGGWEVLTWASDTNRPKIRPETVRFDLEVAGVAQRNIVYNQDQKPVQITYKGGTTNLTYDGAGERIKKVKGSETVIYIGGIYEIRNGQAMSYIFANGKNIVTLTNNKEYYTHSDHLGSTSVVTDENGTIVEEIGYLPFGATLFRNVYNGSTWESTYRFTGQELDNEYGLYNYNARLYDPVMSRFISPDTIVPEPFNPQSLNRYSYCFNNPLKYIDPSGHGAGVYGDGRYNPWSSADWWNGFSYSYFINNPNLFGLLAGPAIFGIEQASEIFEFRTSTITTSFPWGQTLIYKETFPVLFDNDQFMRDLTENSTLNNDSGFNFGIPVGAAGTTISAVTEYAENMVRTHYKTGGRNPFSWSKLLPIEQAERMKHVLGNNGVKYLKYSKWAGVAGSALTVGMAGYDIYKGEGTIIDYCDVGVGSASIGAAIFLASNPVGWVIGTGAAIYFTGRLAYDIYKEVKD